MSIHNKAGRERKLNYWAEMQIQLGAEEQNQLILRVAKCYAHKRLKFAKDFLEKVPSSFHAENAFSHPIFAN